MHGGPRVTAVAVRDRQQAPKERADIYDLWSEQKS